MTTSCLRWQRPARLLLRVSAICWLLVSMAAYAALGATVSTTGPITGGKGIKYRFQTPLLYFTLSAGTGCFGDGGTFPGLSFDGSGTTTFATNADFITPGNPRDAFLVSGTVSGVPFLHANNNGGGSSVTGGSFVDSSDSSKVDLTWTASSASYTISNRYTTDATKPYIQVATTITAIASITGLRFGRSCDPDQDSPVGTTRTVNTCGWTDGSLTASSSDIVIASGPIRPTLIIAMYTNDATPHGAGVSSGWSGDPAAYFNQCSAGTGDYAIGLSFNIGDLAAGASHTVRYTYAFASQTADFKVLLQALTSGGSACAAGKYIVSATPYVCTDCPAGSYNASTDAVSCGACPAGSYSNAGATSCTLCSANTYSGSVNSSSCTACPLGSHSRTGATSCITWTESGTSSLSLTPSPSYTDSVSQSATLSLSLSESASYTDTVSQSATQSLSMSGSESYTDTVSQSATLSLSLSESESYTDTVSESATLSLSLTLSQTRNVSVSSSKTLSKSQSSRSLSRSPSPSHVTHSLGHTRSKTHDVGHIVVTTVRVTFNGTQWTVAMSVSRATIIRNLRESVAAALGLPVENVEVLNVAVGSLVVTYQVTRNSTYAILDSGLHRIAQTEAAYSTLLSWYLATTGEIATLSSYVVVEYNEVPPTTDVVIPLVVVGSVLCVVALLSVRWWVLRRPSAVAVVPNEELSPKPPTHHPVV